MDPNICDDDVIDAFRIGAAKDGDGNLKKYRTIVVQFKHRNTRNRIYQNKKHIRSQVQNGNGIFINENLCRETKGLFRQANFLKKEKNWKFIWTSNGRILMRKDENSRVMFIRNYNSLNLIN